MNLDLMLEVTERLCNRAEQLCKVFERAELFVEHKNIKVKLQIQNILQLVTKLCLVRCCWAIAQAEEREATMATKTIDPDSVTTDGLCLISCRHVFP